MEIAASIPERGIVIVSPGGLGGSVAEKIQAEFPDQKVMIIKEEPFPKSEPFLIKAQPIFAYEPRIEKQVKSYIDGTRSQKNNYKKRKRK